MLQLIALYVATEIIMHG